MSAKEPTATSMIAAPRRLLERTALVGGPAIPEVPPGPDYRQEELQLVGRPPPGLVAVMIPPAHEDLGQNLDRRARRGRAEKPEHVLVAHRDVRKGPHLVKCLP